MNALVTGGTGFVGSHLTEALTGRGWNVRVIAKDAMYHGDLGVETVIADLRDETVLAPLLRDADYIFHVAGLTRACSAAEYYAGNHLATMDLLRNCERHCRSLQRLVYVSSLTAVGPRTGRDEVDERTPYHPVSHYGRSKMLAELEVLDAARKLPVSIVRPSAIYGPRDRDLFRYFSIIRRGLQPLMGEAGHEVNLVHVDDVVRGILCAADHPAAIGEVFNIGNGNYTNEEICGAIAAAEGRQPLIFYLPETLAFLTGLAGECCGKLTRRQVFLNAQKIREVVQKSWTCTIEKARNMIGYRPQVALTPGIHMTYAWYVEKGWL